MVDVPRDYDATGDEFGFSTIGGVGRDTGQYNAHDEMFPDKTHMVTTVFGKSLEEIRALILAAAIPVPMLLNCPLCGVRHIDKGEFAMRPHHTHACQGCGMVWRPAKVDTVGVQFLPGYKDKPL